MGRILPEGAVAKVKFFVTRVPALAAHAAEVGTTPAAVAELGARTQAAQEAYLAQQLLHAQARAATQTFHDAVAAMAEAGADVFKQVKAKAATDGNAIYGLVLLPVPARPAPLPPPGTPAAFAAELLPDGSLRLRWQCKNPAGSAGTIYQVSRRLGAAGESGGSGGSGGFAVIGVSGVKRFVDHTLPAGAGAGAGSATYRVVAIRSTVAGPAALFTVKFGGAGGGWAADGMQVADASRLAA